MKTAPADSKLLRQGRADDELRGQAATGAGGHGGECFAEGSVDGLRRKGGLRRPRAIGVVDCLSGKGEEKVGGEEGGKRQKSKRRSKTLVERRG